MEIQTVNNTKHNFVKLVLVLLLFHGGFFVSQAQAQEVVWSTPFYTQENNYTQCSGSNPFKMRVTPGVDLYDIDEVRVPFSVLNAGANRGSWSDMRFYIDGSLQETVPSWTMTWLYHNGTNQIDENTDNWTKIPLAGSYNVASTSYVEVEVTCSGFSLFKDISTSNGRTGANYIYENGSIPSYSRGPLLALKGGTAPPVAGPYVPPNFSLTGTSSSFLSEVSTPLIASVQETGANIWPMFVFVGVSLAFVIALQMIVFTKRATGVSSATLGDPRRSRRRKNAYSDPLHPDHEAFERGKRANKADGIDLFPDDK